MGLKQDAWKAILSSYDLTLSQRVSPEVTAQEIKDATGGREPRLVCSMDSRHSVPEVLQQRGLFVLPVRNGVYRLVEGKGYEELPSIDGSPETWAHSLWFNFATREGSGEDPHLLYTYNTGLLSEFTGVDSLYQTSVGRRRSTRFEFKVGPSRPLTVEGVQFQVDGLFESSDEIIVVEAKVGAREDFLIRQLYYPYRHYDEETTKGVRTVFFVYDEDSDIYNFWDYHFNDPYDYASVELQGARKFRISPTEPDLDEYREVDRREELGWVIPQADTVERLQEIPFLVKRGYRNSKALQECYGFRRRQANYYSKAVEENLGLIDRSGGNYTLTDLGREYVNLRPDRRHELLARQMLQSPIINEIFQTLVERYVENLGRGDAVITRSEIAELIGENANLTGTTLDRRARTILAWFEWMSRHVGIIWVEGNELRLVLEPFGAGGQ